MELRQSGTRVGRHVPRRAVIVAVAAALSAAGFHCPDPVEPSWPAPLWRVPGITHVLPAFDSANAYFAGWGHDLVAVDKVSGVIQWRQPVPYVPTCYGPDSIVVGNALRIAGGSVITMDDGLFAFDPANGSHRWTWRPPLGCMNLTSLPGSDGTTIYAGASRGSIYAIDGQSGAQLWRGQFRPESAVVAFNPLVSGGVVYAEFNVYVAGPPFDSGGVVALDAATGATLWIRHFPRTSATIDPQGFRRVALTPSLVIAPSNEVVFAIDRTTGNIQWQVNPGGGGDPSVAVFGNRVYIGTGLGLLVVYDAATGSELWRRNYSGAVSDIVADSSTLYCRIGYSSLAAMDPATGDIRWRFGLVSGRVTYTGVLSPFVLDTDRIYFGTNDGYYAYPR